MRKSLFASLLVVGALSACKSRPAEPPAADNTARNARDHQADRAPTSPTADNASQRTADVEVTQKIRKAVMDDSSLSTNAHNCKIIVQNGAVTLAGPVTSAEERAKVEQIAMAIAGNGKVQNQLEIVN